MIVPDGFVPVRSVGARGFARPEAAAWVQETLSRWGTLARAASHDPAAIELQGRGTVRAVPAPGAETDRWVVRRYLRGGWAAPILHDRYVRRSLTRPHREARASEAARLRGIPTPPVQAGIVYPSGPLWYRADLVTRFVPSSVDLAAFLFQGESPGGRDRTGPAERDAALARAGRLVRRLAEAGIFHPDLNAKNFLVVARPDRLDVAVLDLDRARVAGRPVPLEPMAARLTRSLRKFETLTGAALGESAWTAFREATGDPG